jgi:hypothetical protein
MENDEHTPAISCREHTRFRFPFGYLAAFSRLRESSKMRYTDVPDFFADESG